MDQPTESTDMEPSTNHEPPTARDTVPIRPLRRWASRLFITAALVSALGLAWYAASMIRTLADDPEVQATLEQMERRRDSGEPAMADTAASGTLDADTLSAGGEPADSALAPPR